jgi:hypothetical protein
MILYYAPPSRTCVGVPMMVLAPDEIGMNGGRLTNFHDEDLDFPIRVMVGSDDEFAAIVTWVAQNTGPWSFSEGVLDTTFNRFLSWGWDRGRPLPILFSFLSDDDAAIFKLKWSK